MYTLYKLPEEFIITSDEQIAINDIVYSMDGIHEWFGKILKTEPLPLKVIAQQDQIDFSALSEENQKEIGWFDKIINDNFGGLHDIINDRGISEFYMDVLKNYTEQLLSDKMFTLNEVKGLLFQIGTAMRYKGVNYASYYNYKNVKEEVDKIIQSISQPKSWQVELEMEYMVGSNKLTHGNSHITPSLKPNFNNGKVKILKVL
jgi:hypothetical protein